MANTVIIRWQLESGDAATWQALLGDPRVREAFGEAGIPEPASVEILETHNTERGPAFDVL